MESLRNTTTNAVGFSLLPSELLEYIILKLALPDIFRIKSINKIVASIISDRNFIRDYNLISSSSSWFYIYKKTWQRNSVLHGFNDRCDRWFKISIMELLNFVVPPKEDVYFLTASSNYFLFALNSTKELILVNPMCRTVKKIPPSPLGPRGTSMWRRAGMKLLPGPPGSSNFHFLFADYFENRPTLVDYSSETDTWRTIEAREQVTDAPRIGESTGHDHIFLSVANERATSVLILLRSCLDDPIILRPRFNEETEEEERFVIGFSSGSGLDRLHVYGDGNMVIIRSNGCNNRTSKMLKSVELWGVGSDGRSWEIISKVPNVLIDEIKKPYGVIMGCLEERKGIINTIIMSNFEGLWDLIWLLYDKREKNWRWVPVPDCNMKGVNMAGVSFSSGLTFI